MTHATLARLLNPTVVAVIGASDDPSRIGGKPIAYMLKQGYGGRILPVNPKRATVQGLTSYSSIDALPHTPDIAIVAVPASDVLDTVTALIIHHVGQSILIQMHTAQASAANARLQFRQTRALQEQLADE